MTTDDLLRDDLPALNGARVILRAATPAELEELALLLASDPETSPWFGTKPDVIARWLTAKSVRTYLITEADGTLAGLVTFEEEPDPDYRHARIDIGLLSHAVGRGLGTDALSTLVSYLFEARRHHRLTIDPAIENVRAVRAYEKVGFKPVGVMRQYERGPDGTWHDNLLMDVLASEFTRTQHT